MMQILIDKGAKVDRQDSNGNTPFLRAARSLRADRCAFLLDIGANPKDTNKAGKNALELARETYEKAACAWNAKRLAAIERVLADHGIIEDE